VVVIGGGQAGLSVGYHLARSGVNFAILDAHQHIGDAWRQRWDSLRLFTPAKLDGLDGMRFPAPGNYFPTKDEMASYLESYARHFCLPVRNGVRVDRLFKRGGRYVVAAGGQEIEAGQVVVAMGRYQKPKVPAFAEGLASEITQLHSYEYRNLSQLSAGPVVLAGAGNSGADIALEVRRGGHKTWLAGFDLGEVPFRPEGFFGRNLFMPLVLGFVFRHVLTVNTPIGRRVRPAALSKGVPRIRVKARDLVAAGIERVPRLVGVRDGLPLRADGRTLQVANVIWCSGFHPGFDWIDLPVFAKDHGEPQHRSGVVSSQPGLYFIGLNFLHSMSSSMIHGVGRDAARIVGEITARMSGVDPLPAARRNIM
jgi:putative flavoprotein involved in K+ transport